MNVIRVMTVLLSTGVLHYMRTSVPSKAVFLLSFLHIPKTSLSGPLLRFKGMSIWEFMRNSQNVLK